MLAPSEKHLEDWIASNLIQFGDIWDIDAYCEQIGDVHFRNDDTFIISFYDRVIDRQLVLPRGIADLICYDGGSIGVVELKKGGLTIEVLCQCLRYIHDLKNIFYWTINDVRNIENPDRESYLYTGYKNYEVQSQYPNSEIHGMIVGHSIEDKHLLTIANACDIRVVTYDLKDGVYKFVLHDNSYTSVEQYKTYIDQPVGIAMREIMKHFATREEGIRNHGI